MGVANLPDGGAAFSGAVFVGFTLVRGGTTTAIVPEGRAEEGLSEDQQQQRGSGDLEDGEGEGEGEEEWEKEAYELYQWSQELSFDDIR